MRQSQPSSRTGKSKWNGRAIAFSWLATGMVFIFFMVYGQTTTIIQRGEQDKLEEQVEQNRDLIEGLQIKAREQGRIIQGVDMDEAPPVVVAASSQRRSTPAPTPQPRPDPLQPVAGDRAQGTSVQILVDRKEAAPGDVINYTIIARNTDKEEHLFGISSHIPVGTTFVSSSECQEGNIVTNSLTGICPVGSRGRPGRHQITLSRTIPGKKQYVFVFQVALDLDLQEGSIIRNHAHVQGPRIEPRTSEDTRTRVERGTPAPGRKE